MNDDARIGGRDLATTAEFSVDLKPAAPELDATGRFDFSKVWSGGLMGTSRGLMLSAGDPATGEAGYVALEVFEGAIDGHRGTVALQQSGLMSDGDQVLHYDLVPGSGTGGLVGFAGSVELNIQDGTHRVVVRYSKP
jgi:hypothetical protein